MSDRQFSQRVPDAMPGDVEMPRPLRLCPIRMDFHMTEQGVPIQFVGPLWAGALVRQAARLEPAIHARLAHPELPSRLGLAATAPDKIHHPLAQIG